jgi:hypothetical protein
MREASLTQRLFMCCLLFLSISFLATVFAADAPAPLLLLLLARLLLPSAAELPLLLLFTSISPTTSLTYLSLDLLGHGQNCRDLFKKGNKQY